MRNGRIIDIKDTDDIPLPDIFVIAYVQKHCFFDGKTFCGKVFPSPFQNVLKIGMREFEMIGVGWLYLTPQIPPYP